MLHEQIRRLRTAQGATQAELAHRLGVSNWENSNIQPSIELLERLADLFPVTTDFLPGRDARPFLDVSGLTDQQAVHLQLLAEDLRRK